MNYLKTQNYADRRAKPGKIKTGRVIVEIGRKDHSKRQDLGDDVSEKILEGAVLAATKHHDRYDRLDNGMCDPERVEQNFCFLGHPKNFS
jgi:hypothetical protein